MSPFERRNYIQVIFISQVNGVASFVTHLHNVPVIFCMSLWLWETLTQARCIILKKKGKGRCGFLIKELGGGMCCVIAAREAIAPPPLSPSFNNSLLPFLVKDKRKAVFLFLFFLHVRFFTLQKGERFLLRVFSIKYFYYPECPEYFAVGFRKPFICQSLPQIYLFLRSPLILLTYIVNLLTSDV